MSPLTFLQNDNRLGQVLIISVVLVVVLGFGQELYLPEIALLFLVLFTVYSLITDFQDGKTGSLGLLFNLFVYLGFIAWLAFFYFGYQVWYAEGTLEPDAVHTVEMNSHGNIRYITEQQDWMKSLLFLWGLIAILFGVIFEVHKKYAAKKTSS